MEVAMTNVDYSRDAAAGASKARAKSVAMSSAAWPTSTPWSRIVATVSTPDFIAVAIFSTIGLLVTANLMLHGFDIATM
jgi:hypothetical protein